MGIFDVISNLFEESASGLTCPKCGREVHEQDIRYYCDYCKIRFVLEDGRLLDPFNPSDWDTGKTCVNCQCSLTGGEYVMAWEEGNSEPYTICPHCGYHN